MEAKWDRAAEGAGVGRSEEDADERCGVDETDGEGETA